MSNQSTVQVRFLRNYSLGNTFAEQYAVLPVSIKQAQTLRSAGVVEMVDAGSDNESTALAKPEVMTPKVDAGSDNESTAVAKPEVPAPKVAAARRKVGGSDE